MDPEKKCNLLFFLLLFFLSRRTKSSQAYLHTDLCSRKRLCKTSGVEYLAQRPRKIRF